MLLVFPMTSFFDSHVLSRMVCMKVFRAQPPRNPCMARLWLDAAVSQHSETSDRVRRRGNGEDEA